jgi:hypothetical protein
MRTLQSRNAPMPWLCVMICLTVYLRDDGIGPLVLTQDEINVLARYRLRYYVYNGNTLATIDGVDH